MEAAENAGQQTVGSHRVENARLAVQQHQHHGRQPGDDARFDQSDQPANPNGPNADGNWVRDVQRFERNQAGQHSGNQNIQRRADRKRPQDADRHILLRVLRLLRRAGNRVKADVREENHARAAQNAAHAEAAEVARVRRQERVPVRRVNVFRAEPQKRRNDNQLDGDDDGVRACRLFGAGRKQGRDP